MSEDLTFAGFAAMFRLGPEKITMTKADAVRLAEVAQVASDEITRLRAELATARKDALEEEAKIADNYANRNHVSLNIAAAIRAAAGDARPSEEIIREDRDAWEVKS